MEPQVGIQEYTQKGNGFSTALKRLYSDCQVNVSTTSQPKKQNSSTFKSTPSPSPIAIKRKSLRFPAVVCDMKYEDDTNPMSPVEKRQLSIDIQLLPSDKLARVVHIFRSLEPVDGPVPEEVVMDLDKVKPSTLKALQLYMDSIPTTRFCKTYEAKRLGKGKNKQKLADTFLSVPTADSTNAVHSIVSKQVPDVGIGIASTASTLSNAKADGNFDLVVEFNIPPSSCIIVANREIVKMDVNTMVDGGTKICEHPTQRKSSSEEPPKKGFELEEIVSEITSGDESPLKFQNKRLKLSASR
ncbi:uncharacterized protein LOC130693297 [Daphnia carinata]|uniref:uncharacterized protein LOC130693297 n=1 Tax=Daphnia carinata TaxID=120202 RepID=UPI002579FCB9|nr:uncharacterized protein LOC130693297 [Daphnia carinata]